MKGALKILSMFLLATLLLEESSEVERENKALLEKSLSSSSVKWDAIGNRNDYADILKKYPFRNEEIQINICELTKNRKEIISIVYPETQRYNLLQDIIKSTIDESLYVQYGIADYSIGLFQMKPSFIEQLEGYVVKNDLSQYSFIKIDCDNIVKCRKERIRRLKQEAWQLKYAFVFWEVARHLFKELLFDSKEEQIHFFATAYNYGFLKTIDEIKAWQCKRAFPYGLKYRGPQESYGDMAVKYYKSQSNLIAHERI